MRKPITSAKASSITNMADKRYYWLKLKRDFFKRHDIRIIESMPNGKDYILFYLKLLCESVDHDGSLRFSEQIPYNEDMLATITNTNVDIVRNAINIFAQLGMMEILDDGTYFMAEVQKMIGSAADNDNANRQRRFREKQKELALPNRYESVTKSNESKSKSKSIELEKDKEKDIKKRENREIAKKVLEYLNQKAGKNFKPVDSNISMINARLEEGYKYEDFVKVVDVKYSEWKYTDYEKYIRPNTLFCKSHFDNYLNQKEEIREGAEFFGY